MARTVTTEIEINAPTSTVWDNLTQLESFAEWNPFITRSSGTVAVGSKLENHMDLPGGRAMTFKPTVTEVKEGEVFEWLGSLPLAKLFDGRHRFELHPTPSGGTRLVHSEVFTGLLVPIMGAKLYERTEAGFVAMNEALKARAEAAA